MRSGRRRRSIGNRLSNVEDAVRIGVRLAEADIRAAGSVRGVAARFACAFHELLRAVPRLVKTLLTEHVGIVRMNHVGSSRSMGRVCRVEPHSGDGPI